MGGLARKATIIESERNSLISNLLVFDSGDLFYLDKKKYNDDTRKIHANIIAESHNRIGCTAFTPGKRDLMEFEIDYFLKLVEDNSLNFTSCNIYKNDKSTRFFSEYGIVDLNDFKVGYIGATSMFNIPGVHVKEPISEIKNTLDKIAADLDFVVLLFNGNKSDLSRLQQSDMDIDVIFNSRGEGHLNSKASSDGGNDRIPVFTSGNRGKYLNKVLFEINTSSSSFIDVSSREKKIKSSKKYLKNKRDKNPGKDIKVVYKENEKVLNDIIFHDSRISSLKSEIDAASNKFTTEKIALNSSVDSQPDLVLYIDKEMSKIVKGPPMPDHKGRPPGHPHHGHNH